VITCTGLDPITIKVIGRTAAYIDVASECTPLEPIEKTMMQFAEKVGGTIASYHVAPGDRQRDELGFYDVVIEWDCPPTTKHSPTDLAKLFDESLAQAFGYYQDERHVTHTIREPHLRVLPQGTFYARAAKHNKLGGQHKVPKVVNNRSIIDDLLSRI
jgi:GH3 auxin-responsive promoter